MQFKYKLKMTVDGTEHLAPITWTDALGNIFNKRKRRISDYNGALGLPSATQSTLSGSLTYGVCLTNDANVPLIPKDTNFTWKGKRNTEYTNLSGNVGKVCLTSESVVASNFYNYNGLFPNLNDFCGQNSGGILYNDILYSPLQLEEDGETMIGIYAPLSASNFEIGRFVANDMQWGLDGKRFDNAYNKTIGEVRRKNWTTIYADLVNHKYCYDDEAISELYDVDRDTESETFDNVTISYDTWNCLFYLENSYFGNNDGTSITHDANNIYIIEYLAAKRIRIGQYNDPNHPYSQYPFKPENCDIYFNMTTKQLEGLDTVNFDNLFNVVVVDKETFDVKSIEAKISGLNALSVDLSELVYTALVSTTEVESMKLTSENLPSISNYDCALYATCGDNSKVYITAGYGRTINKLYSITVSQFEEDNLPNTFNIVCEMTSEIADFCHTINRRNLYANASILSMTLNNTDNNLGVLVNQETGIVNWIGFINYLVSGIADFGGVSVSSGQTVKFELIEVVSEE